MLLILLQAARNGQVPPREEGVMVDLSTVLVLLIYSSNMGQV